MEDRELTKILRDYHVAQPRRATGGLFALSGFDFQLRVYLADFVAALAGNGDADSAGTCFLEALSDFVRTEGGSDGGLVCVQVKRTLDHQSLAAAAMEFGVIDQFCSSTIEARPSRLPRYEVVGRFGGTNLSWDALTFSDSTRREKPELVARFELIRSEARLGGIRRDSDPWWRLIASVFHVLDDPFAFAREALDLCLGIDRSPAGPEILRNRISELFKKRRRVNPKPGRVVRPEDFTPHPYPPSDILVGQTPSLDLLRDGHYMPRGVHVAVAASALEQLLATRASGIYQAIDMFWIDGRSGCGKSVLLLQLMEEMVRRGLRVVWLGGQTGELLDTLESLDPEAERNPDLIFIDDFYDPQGQQAVRLQSVLQHVAQHPRSGWPTIATCGPPEFHELLTRDTGDVGVKVHPWRLPTVDLDEAKALRGWYHHRTGRDAKTGPAFRQSEGLIVSMALEMRHGRIEPLARRFRARVRIVGLEECLRVPMALNRLYIWTPVDWFTRKEREALEQLNADRDFSLLQGRLTGSTYVRLTHPHLSDWIYKAIRERCTPLAIANDLVDAFERALREDVSTARRLLRVVANGHDRLGEADAAVLVNGFAKAWTDSGVGANEADEFLSDTWTSWACWASREPAIAGTLGAAPLETARRIIFGAGVELSNVLWDRLHRAYPDHSGLVLDAVNWLTDPAAIGRLAWPYVWQRTFDARHLLPSGVSLAPVLLVGWKWLDEREERPAWSYVWERLLDALDLPEPIHRDELLRRGYSWLCNPEHEARLDWTHVWERLLDAEDGPEPIHRDELLQRGFDWLKGREDRPDWSPVWGRLMRVTSLPAGLERQDLVDSGVQWLKRGNQNANPDWGYAFELILKGGYADLSLLEVGAVWLLEHKESPEVPAMADLVLTAGNKDPRLDALAEWFADWLRRNPDDLTIFHTFRHLRRQLGGDSDARASGPGWASLAAWVREHDQTLAPHFERLREHQRRGDTVTGQIVRRGRVGFFVDVGVSALLRLKDIPPNAVPRLNAELGHTMEFTVSVVAEDQQTVLLALPGSPPAAMPVVGQVAEASVTGTQPYGVFFEVGGVPGLLHCSLLALSDAPSDLATRFPRGRCLRVRVIRVDEVKRRLALAPAWEGY